MGWQLHPVCRSLRYALCCALQKSRLRYVCPTALGFNGIWNLALSSIVMGTGADAEDLTHHILPGFPMLKQLAVGSSQAIVVVRRDRSLQFAAIPLNLL